MTEDEMKSAIDLGQLAQQARQAIIDERKAEIVRAIQTRFASIRQHQRDIEEARKLIERRTKSIAQAQATVDRLMQGDWSALREEQKAREQVND